MKFEGKMNTKVVQVGLGILALIGVVIAVTILFPKTEYFSRDVCMTRRNPRLSLN